MNFVDGTDSEFIEKPKNIVSYQIKISTTKIHIKCPYIRIHELYVYGNFTWLKFKIFISTT